MEMDADMTLSRVLAVHREGARGQAVVNGEIWVVTKRDDARRDDRQLRLGDSSEQYFFGRDDTYPGRVVYRIPLVGLLGLLVGDPMVFVYLVLFAWLIRAGIDAGNAAKRAREAAKPAIVRKQAAATAGRK
jgi:hypothetical protein